MRYNHKKLTRTNVKDKYTLLSNVCWRMDLKASNGVGLCDSDDICDYMWHRINKKNIYLWLCELNKTDIFIYY